MNGPCEYCGASVADAETFFRLGVMPCCPACGKHPLLRGLAWFVFSTAALVLGAAMYLALP